MSEINKKRLKYFRMAKLLREGKVELSKKDKKMFVRCIKELLSPCEDLRTDFTTASGGNVPIEPMYLQEEDDQTNPVSNTFVQKGKNFEEYINTFSGLQFKPKELEAVSNLEKQPENTNDQFSLKFKTSDVDGNEEHIIKKLRQGNDLVFVDFMKTTSINTNSEDEKQQGDNITVTTSTPFRDEIEGGKILAQFLQKLEI